MPVSPELDVFRGVLDAETKAYISQAMPSCHYVCQAVREFLTEINEEHVSTMTHKAQLEKNAISEGSCHGRRNQQPWYLRGIFNALLSNTTILFLLELLNNHGILKISIGIIVTNTVVSTQY